MNPIRIIQLAQAVLNPKCWRCWDKGYTLKPWKRGGVWVFEKVPCECTKGDKS